MATWNIITGRGGGLEAACRALPALGVDLALLQETKLTGGVYTRNAFGYRVVASDAPSAQQGGVALVWREEHPEFEVEEVKIRHPNVLSFEMKTGMTRYYVVGCYLPPSSPIKEALEPVVAALRDAPRGVDEEIYALGGPERAPQHARDGTG